MDFGLDENQEMLRQMTRELARSALAPEAGAWDRAGAAPDGVWARLAELGLFGVCAPESHGGAGMDLASLAVAVEELGAGEAGVASVVLTHNALCVGHIARAGSVPQMKRWLPGLASGAVIGTWAGVLGRGAVDGGRGADADGVAAGRVAAGGDGGGAGGGGGGDRGDGAGAGDGVRARAGSGAR
ncbi:MAG: acyl-CoA dehydrogenase family protein [bacterium]